MITNNNYSRLPRRFQTQRGLVRTIVLVVIFLLVISYFGLNLRDVINDPTTHSNFSFVWEHVTRIWNSYLKEPIVWVWNEIIVKYIVMLGIKK
jgi:hypothetical protein